MKGKEFKEKRSKAKIYWAIFIVVIMLSSSIAFVNNFITNGPDTKNNKVDYNGFTFFKSQNGWITSYNGQQFELSYLPDEINELNADNIDIDGNKVYLAYNVSNYNQLMLFNMQRIGFILGLKKINAVLACVDENNCPDIPIVDCNNDNKVIYFKKSDRYQTNNSNEPGVNTINNCIIVEASDDIGFNKASDKIIYKVIGIV